jgi:hypothetical protein
MDQARDATNAKGAPPTAPKRFSRKKLIVFPKFQLPLLAINLVTLGVVSLILWVGMENTISDLRPAAGLSALEAQTYRHYLNYEVRSFEWTLVLGLGTGLILSTFLTLLITHRFSGPLVRMRNYFRALGEGEECSRLEFRDGDYLREFPPLINDAINRVRKG